MNTRPGRTPAGIILLAALLASEVSALPPEQPDLTALVRSGEPVSSIPTADSVQAFAALDDEHVLLSLGEERSYVLTLNRECFGLRWARHVGVTASENTIWAGFDALTADGEACPIREIHLVREPVLDTL